MLHYHELLDICWWRFYTKYTKSETIGGVVAWLRSRIGPQPLTQIPQSSRWNGLTTSKKLAVIGLPVGQYLKLGATIDSRDSPFQNVALCW